METSVASPLPIPLPSLPPHAPIAASATAAYPPAPLTSSTTAATLVSKTVVYPSRKSAMGDLQLSVSDLPMLSCHYIQKGLLFPKPPVPAQHLLSHLRLSLSRALTLFPALAGRLVTHPDDGRVFISCNDSGVPFSHYTLAAATGPAGAPVLTLPQVTLAVSVADVPAAVKEFLFDFDGAVSYEGHSRPLAAVRVTELSDGSLFVGCTVNHAVVDGTSFWNFFNCWAELCRRGAVHDGADGVSGRLPDFTRNFFGGSTAVLRFADGRGPAVTFDPTAPLRERIFHFSRHAIRELKAAANRPLMISDSEYPTAEVDSKPANRTTGEILSSPSPTSSYMRRVSEARVITPETTEVSKLPENRTTDEISSFQSLCALLWRSVTRARRHKLGPDAATTLRLAVNCRHRVDPPIDPLYFGNAIQSIPTAATVGEVATRELRWAAALVHQSVAGYTTERVREVVAEWERAPRCFPLGNPDGGVLTVGSSPRFPMYDGNDFGWGSPVAVRSGRANKFDGKVSAFPPADGEGGVELEVCLAPDTMAALVSDLEFMGYVSHPEEK